jgi:serpin B
VRSFAVLLVALALVAAACGDADEPTASTEPVDPSTSPAPPDDAPTTDPATPESPVVEAALVDVPERAAPSVPPDLAGASVTDFGHDIYAAAASVTDADANLILSPLSIAIALAMLEPGANDEALEQLHQLLRIDDPTAWHASMNALEIELESRVAELPGGGTDDQQDPGELTVQVANAAFLQPGYPFRTDYLETIGTNYGAVLEELDFASDQEAAAARINEFIAEATDDHITDLVSPSDIDPATVLALVNALLLQASWETQLDVEQTADDDFTRPGGSTVTVPMMQGRGDSSASGDGWVGASKRLVGGLQFDVVLPDDGRFDEVAARVGAIFDRTEGRQLPAGRLDIPRFETRVTVGLTDALKAAGLTAPFGQGQLLGIADDPQTQLDQALHQTWISIDEDGIEAAAATVLIMIATSAPVDQPVDVILDRPFLFRIVDTVTGATLFMGRVTDPTS